jgi:hypothetical protein
MRDAKRLLAAVAVGALVAIGVEAIGQSTKQACTGSSDLSWIHKRFDDLEQAITTLQTQSAKAASDDALANSNNQRQLANISSQVADLNTKVVELTGTVHTLPPPPPR